MHVRRSPFFRSWAFPGWAALRPDPFTVALKQLADEENVRIFAERCAKGLLERSCVRTDLALAHQAVDVRVDELDRVFDGDDVIVAGAIHVVDHRRQRGRLA